MQNDILSKLIQYEIRIRKAVNGNLHGNFKSIFKGSGLEFSDLRQYNHGDDQRLIDWNASLKGHGMFVKLFKEEKEQQVFFMVDVSSSQQVGYLENKKINRAKEIAGTMAISAIKEASKVGIYCFTDQKELFLKPESTMKHGYRLITQLLQLEAVSGGTHIQNAILFTLQHLKKRSVVILISDFIDENYDQNLKALARIHDLVVIHLYDQKETELPRMGIVPVYDLEQQKLQWANTSSSSFRDQLKNTFAQNKAKLEQLCKENRANYIHIESSEDYVDKLIKLFKIRK